MARVEGFEVGRSGIEPVDGNGDPVSVGVWGDSDNGMGVFGTSGQLPTGTTFFLGSEPAGVAGNSVQNPGVIGRSADNIGVLGQSRDASGLFGVSFSPSGSGVVAANAAGGNGVESFVGDGAAMLGSSRRTGYGVAGGNFGSSTQPATGVGVDGYNADTGIGVRGHSPNGQGVYGSSDNGLGVWGHSNNSAGVQGTGSVVAVQGYSHNGLGVRGSSDNNVGVRGSSSNGVGVQGSSNSHVGVRGEGVEGEGVRGTSLTNNALTGISWTGTGAEGTSIIGYGVTGYNYGSVDREDPPGAGVLGSSNQDPGVVGYSARSWAGEFLGSVRIHGNLSLGGTISFFNAAGMHFKIDHPADPANKYLNHSSVASPEMKNVYDGVVELDEDGAATVELPEWFGELNEDFRYQLTPIGGIRSGVVRRRRDRRQSLRDSGGRAQHEGLVAGHGRSAGPVGGRQI